MPKIKGTIKGEKSLLKTVRFTIISMIYNAKINPNVLRNVFEFFLWF
jgi:hypothetical protein